jgi:hypothetical protein
MGQTAISCTDRRQASPEARPDRLTQVATTHLSHEYQQQARPPPGLSCRQEDVQHNASPRQACAIEQSPTRGMRAPPGLGSDRDTLQQNAAQWYALSTKQPRKPVVRVPPGLQIDQATVEHNAFQWHAMAMAQSSQ